MLKSESTIHIFKVPNDKYHSWYTAIQFDGYVLSILNLFDC